jgi:hypothetical protein
MATNLLIAASFASSGDFPQVSRDISEQLEANSQKPLSFLSKVLRKENYDSSLTEMRFEPRLEETGSLEGDDDLFAPRLRALSQSSSFDTSPGSSPVKTAADSLVKAFSNIQLVSPTYFQLSQVASKAEAAAVTPEELQAKGNYSCNRPDSTRSHASIGGASHKSFFSAAGATTITSTATPSKLRKSLADMVHSVDPSLFPKPLQRLSESPVLARLGNIITGGMKSSATGSLNGNSSVASSDDSFHTAHMTEETMSDPTPNRTSSNISPSSRKRNYDGNRAMDAQVSSSSSSSLLSPHDIPSSTRSKTASSFQSNRHTHRIIYRLKDGRRGMSQQSKEALSNFMPRLFDLGKKPEATPSKRPSPQVKKSAQKKKKDPLPQKVYVLLLVVSQKLFEICPIDYVRDMTVGDVLAKVRTNATDPVLAAQPYKSLLNDTIEFSAPMLPLVLLLQRGEQKPLLTALPPGVGPDECRRIKSILMNHPSVQRFWANDDPFEPSPAKKQRRV